MATGTNSNTETVTLASRDVIVWTLEVTESLEDLDCRGLFSFEIEKAY